MTLDRKLLGEAVEMLIDSSGRSKVQFAKEAGVSRATLYRLIAGDERVEQKTFRRVESTLSLPYDTLSHIARHEWHVLQELGADAALVRWARRQARTD